MKEAVMDTDWKDAPIVVAALNLIGQTGAKAVRVRYQDDEPPTVWVALAEYGGERSLLGAGLSPLAAVLDLCETVIDGGECQYCKKPTGLVGPDDLFPDLLDDVICWYAWDPELSTFRRGCEGDDK
jgi:hypothetical protein